MKKISSSLSPGVLIFWGVRGVGEKKAVYNSQTGCWATSFVLVDDWCLGLKGGKSRRHWGKISSLLDRQEPTYPQNTGSLVAFGDDPCQNRSEQPKAFRVSSNSVRKELPLFKFEVIAESHYYFFGYAVWHEFSKRQVTLFLFATQRNT